MLLGPYNRSLRWDTMEPLPTWWFTGPYCCHLSWVFRSWPSQVCLPTVTSPQPLTDQDDLWCHPSYNNSSNILSVNTSSLSSRLEIQSNCTPGKLCGFFLPWYHVGNIVCSTQASFGLKFGLRGEFLHSTLFFASLVCFLTAALSHEAKLKHAGKAHFSLRQTIPQSDFLAMEKALCCQFHTCLVQIEVGMRGGMSLGFQ